uniref:CHK domain-containing protein n=1 Tax=Syphacia muris TaxID=451379 RepID=A0A0N5AAD6_9BILA
MMSSSPKNNDNTSDSQLFGTSITFEFVEKQLQRFFNTKSKFGKNRKAFHIGVGEGFLSVIARIYPDWTPKSAELPETVIAKIPNIKTAEEFASNEKFNELLGDVEIDKDVMLKMLSSLITRAHNAESAFYQTITESKIEVKIPKLYFQQPFSDDCKQGVLLLEDLGTGCAVSKPYEIVSAEEVKQVLKSLSAVHAFSMKHPEIVKISKLTLADAMKDFGDKDIYQSIVNQLKKKNPDMAETCDTVLKYVHVLKDLSTLETAGEQCGLPPILVHGDLWSSNVLWRKQANGSRQLAAIIDWQVIHRGTPAEDIIRIISCTMTPKDRRAQTDELLHYYYNELENNYGKKLPFELEKLKDSFMKVGAQSMFQVVPILGAVSEVEIDKKCPEKKEELMAILTGKCKGLLEDIVANLTLNHSV